MRGVFTALLAGLLLTAPSVAAEPYRLGAGDRIRIEVFEQPTLTREAMVQADGSVRLPRLGSMTLEGLTLEETENTLAERLQSGLGLSQPDVAVEIVAYRPVYVSGDVETPGAYAYAPGMTVMHAIALAGGYRRPEPGDANVRLEAGRLLERLEQLRDQLAISHARLARFEAERDGGAEATLPPELASLAEPRRVAELRAQEAATMNERKTSLEGALRIFDQRRDQLRNEITALMAQRDAKIEQVAILRSEGESIKGLLEQGLVPASRGFELQRTIIGAEADRREVEAFMARARGETAAVDQAELNLSSDRRLDIATGIKNALDEIAQQKATIASVEAQIGVARALSQGLDITIDATGIDFDRPMVRRRGADEFAPIGLTDLLGPDDLVAIPQPARKPRD